MAARVATRKQFAQSIVTVCKRMGLDGIDIDWEESFQGNEKMALAYGKLIKETAKAAKAENLTLTMAYHPGQDAAFSSKEFTKNVDRFHLMAYDHCQALPCNHSSLASAEAHIQAAIKHLPAHKIVLGLPAYGRKMQNPGEVQTYAELAASHPCKLDAEDDARDGHFFNGPYTARLKARLAERYGLAGVFVWEAGQDLPATHEGSLLRSLWTERARINSDRANRKADASQSEL